jgi:hypothetical protein
MIKLNDVISDEAAAAGNELQGEFALAHTTFPYEQHPHTEHIEEDPVPSYKLGQCPSEIRAYHPDDLKAWER